MHKAMPPAKIRLIRHPGVLPIIGGRSLSSLASQMQAVVVGWQIYALTGSAFSLGLVGLAQFLPVVVLGFVAGHVVDRSDRRRIAGTCQIIACLAALALAAASFAHMLTPSMIYGLVVVVGAVRAFEAPSLQALLPALVPAEAFPQAAALSSSLFQTATIVGPSLGGLLYGLGPDVAYANLCCNLPSCRTLHTHGAADPPRRRPGAANPRLGVRRTDLHSPAAGNPRRHLARPVRRAAGRCDRTPPGLCTRHPQGRTARLRPAARSTRPRRHRRGRSGSPGAPCAANSACACSRRSSCSASPPSHSASRPTCRSPWQPSRSSAAQTSSGVVIRSTLVQMRTPDAMRGRVAAVNMLFIGSSNQLGEFESGTLAGFVGAVPAVVIGGVGTLAVAWIWMALFPQLRRLDRVEV